MINVKVCLCFCSESKIKCSIGLTVTVALNQWLTLEICEYGSWILVKTIFVDFLIFIFLENLEKISCLNDNACMTTDADSRCHFLLNGSGFCVPRACTVDKKCPTVGTAMSGAISGTCLPDGKCNYSVAMMIAWALII